MNKHTKGPWFFQVQQANRQALRQKPYVRVYHNGDFDIHTNTELNDETVANARLIAASPELLQACKDLVNFYDQSREKFKLAKGYPDPSGFIENLDRYIPYLKDAITKAEGGSNE